MNKACLFPIITCFSGYLLLKIFGPVDMLWCSIASCVLISTPLAIFGIALFILLPDNDLENEVAAHHSPFSPPASKAISSKIEAHNDTIELGHRSKIELDL